MPASNVSNSQKGYRPSNGFSPGVMTLITDMMRGHGKDLSSLSTMLAFHAEESADESSARILSQISMGIEGVAKRVKADAERAALEASKLAPAGVHARFCLCGRDIHSGTCPTGGHCHRGVAVDCRA
jgi:hypothetical protein